MEHDHAKLWEAARSGDLGARVAMARHYLESGRTARGLKWLREAGADGSVEALLTLGRELRSNARSAKDFPGALKAFRTAAETGDAAACHELAEMLFLGLGTRPDPAAAATWLGRAAAGGWAPALRTLGLVHTMNGEADLAKKTVKLAGGETVDFTDQVTTFRWPGSLDFEKDRISESPQITVIRGFMSSDECDYVINRGAPALRHSQTGDPLAGQATVNQTRTSSDMGFDVERMDIVIRLIEERMAAACGVPREHGEPLVLLHYAPGQEYKNHFDFIDTGEWETRFGGQRVVTFLVYLNDVEAGGATVFPRANLSMRGNKGDALFFRNVTASGEPDPLTLHHGAPVEAGEKWLASKWIRERPHPETVRRNGPGDQGP